MNRSITGSAPLLSSLEDPSSLSSSLSINNNNKDSSSSSSNAARRKRYSLIYSLTAAENDAEVQDELANAQRRLRVLKTKISSQSKKNFVFERDVKYLEERIALLIKNRIHLDEITNTSLLESVDLVKAGKVLDDRKIQQYGALFFLLQTEPRHVATLTRLVDFGQINELLHTVMFTIYGNQYESREEHLLLSMFQSVLSTQFEASTEFGSLLRANTPVSRMMTTYTRRGPGQSFLKQVLADRIASVVKNKHVNLEINSPDVYKNIIKEQIEAENGTVEQGMVAHVSYEEAEKNEQVQAIIKPRFAILIDIVNSFLNSIIGNLESVPYGIRWICKQIRSLTKRSYPDASDYSICSLIGGFFFLRYVNPAIVTPAAYMIIDEQPTDYPKRTLTLVAKILQNLANKPSFAKEPYMQAIGPFVDANKARINKFLNDLCEVGDFYETLEMDQYMALSRKELKLTITLNELYKTQSLLLKHLDELAPNSVTHLNVLLKEMGPAPAQVPRSENATIELPLFSRFEQNVQGFKSSLELTELDISFMETKSVFVQLIRSLPQSAAGIERPINLDKVVESASQSKYPALVRKGIKAMEMLRDLGEQKAVDAKDRYNPLTEEIEYEISNLSSMREKTILETRALESVYKSLCDHNDYLRSQLETYKSYLKNVRIQSSGSSDKNSKSVTGGVGLVMVGGKKREAVKRPLGPVEFTHQQLERRQVIAESNIPESFQSNIYVSITSPIPATFVISLHYKGRARELLKVELKLDDLLEMQQNNIQLLDLEYVQFNVPNTLTLLNKSFKRKK